MRNERVGQVNLDTTLTLSIHRVQQLCVALLDDVALDLAGRRQDTILGSPLLVHEADVLYNLEGLELRGLADLGDRLEHKVLGGLGGAEGGAGEGLGGLEVAYEGVFVGRHDADGEGLERVGVDAHVVDVRAVAGDRLELLERNVLAERGLDEVLLTIDDLQGAVLEPLTDITAAEPAVRVAGISEGLGGRSGQLVVAL